MLNYVNTQLRKSIESHYGNNTSCRSFDSYFQCWQPCTPLPFRAWSAVRTPLQFAL